MLSKQLWLYIFVGNIRQGPVGYVPNCHCEASKRTIGIDPTPDHKHITPYDRMAASNRILSERLRELELLASQKVSGCLLQ